MRSTLRSQVDDRPSKTVHQERTISAADKLHMPQQQDLNSKPPIAAPQWTVSDDLGLKRFMLGGDNYIITALDGQRSRGFGFAKRSASPEFLFEKPRDGERKGVLFDGQIELRSVLDRKRSSLHWYHSYAANIVKVCNAIWGTWQQEQCCEVEYDMYDYVPETLLDHPDKEKVIRGSRNWEALRVARDAQFSDLPLLPP